MIEILTRIMAIIERVRNMEELSVIATGVFGVILVFGILNCLLGYRLLSFWMMLGGFGVGAGAGLFIASTLEVSGRGAYLGIMAVTGIVLGGIAFLSYKVGVFVLGAGIGVSLSVYILHPTTSFVFFICLLLGVGLGLWHQHLNIIRYNTPLIYSPVGLETALNLLFDLFIVKSELSCPRA